MFDRYCVVFIKNKFYIVHYTQLDEYIKHVNNMCSAFEFEKDAKIELKRLNILYKKFICCKGSEDNDK